MSRGKRAPRIVAELGRPETPEETADRLFESSRKYRSRKTINNLVLSLLATLVTVFLIVIIVPRSETPLTRDVDYGTIVKQLQSSVDEPLANPGLPSGWHANAAEWRTGGGDKVPSWYIGLITPADDFIGFSQAIDANATWLSQLLGDAPATDNVEVDGISWDVYRNPAAQGDRGNFDYAFVTSAGTSTYALIGTADTDEFRVLAEALTANIRLNGAQ